MPTEGCMLPRRAFIAQTAGLVAATLGCGRGSREVAPEPALFRADCCPRWSPDGKHIAFLRVYEGGLFDICLTDAHLREVRTIAAHRQALHALWPRSRRSAFFGLQDIAWHPDGSRIAFSERLQQERPENETRLWLGLRFVRVSDGQVMPLVEPDAEEEEAPGQFRSPRWSPRGKRLAFVAEGRGGVCRIGMKAMADGPPEAHALRFDAFVDSDLPVWSPTGERLAFRQGILRALTSTPVETIRVLEPGGKEARVLWRTDPSEYRRAARIGDERVSLQPRVLDLAWSPDGAHIAFSVAADAADIRTSTLWAVRTEESGSADRISPRDSAGYSAPAWQDPATVLAARWGDALEAVQISLATRSVRRLCRLPSDDLDWSPYRRRVAVGTARPLIPPLLTTIQVLDLEG